MPNVGQPRDSIGAFFLYERQKPSSLCCVPLVVLATTGQISGQPPHHAGTLFPVVYLNLHRPLEMIERLTRHAN